MLVDGSSAPMEMVSVNIPAGMFRTVALLRNFFSVAAVSPHLCLSVTLQNTNALYTTATALYVVIMAQSPHCRYCLANPTFQYCILHSSCSLNLTHKLCGVIVTCFYTQLVQMFSLLNNLCLEIVLTFKPYSPSHVL